ncbi:MAG: family oxidoreductase [Frankiales bacterium]|nr:family oxidoreductase [Frankiales bacterium]
MTFDLTGRTALVTGASRGIGRALALGLAHAGADVAITARDGAALGVLREQVETLGRKAVVIEADLTDADACRRLGEEAISALGQVDVLVNNAGGSSFFGPFTDLRFSGWEKTMRLNVDSIVHLSQVVGKHMVDRGAGSIINVASVAGLGGSPMMAAYGASKAAVISLTKTLAVEWGGSGVRVNALCPGWTKTDLNENLWSGPDGGEGFVQGQALKRWATVHEMVGPVVFLASEASSYMTGQSLVIDGGAATLG